ncbi:Chaperone protein HtpG [Madurella mycetomatis]|uniref:Chaperone protein HtpG n=1 Tax=Madurella mycetomatis TaxID=100816 RepID=A0A175WIT5_9PEZI|nr:Chaperone protein HtpG [Madurella mycetomatis]
MGSIPSSKAAAAADLQRLQSERGMANNNLRASDSVLASSLNEALNILSDQLYTTPTHFILELIQNADDNSHASGVTPTLRLSLYEKNGRRFFRTDCNEVGFTFEQLNALTRVGQSTKKSPAGRRKGYIGEKGIGFKAVFKVADVVRVASGYYEFKFDRRRPIGMILPIVSRFPTADRVADHTQFLLPLKSKEDDNAIHRDLKHIEPQLLLFLRQLRELHVSNKGTDNIYRLEATQSDGDYGGETSTISKSDGNGEVVEVSRYVIHRHTVQSLPKESRREGVSTSEVVVAFAVKDRATPITGTQKVFAFLPVDNYGFQFLIHADFLLVASRESLEYDCAWNTALQSGILTALLQVFDRFIALSEVEHGKGLRYTWLRYLTRRSENPTFWSDLHEKMLEGLANKKILWSRDGNTPLRKPRDLYYVPQSYRFDGGDLFDIPSVKSTHLSFAYDSVKHEALLLGVRELDLLGLYRELATWIDDVGVDGIGKQPPEWHRMVSSLFYNASYLKEKLKRLLIIPLRNGQWVSAQEEHLYLPSRDRNELVPTGVTISIVDYDVSQDPIRRRFFEFLEIKEYSPRQVCSLILEFHMKLLGDTRASRSAEELLADAVYIFKHRSELQEDGAPLMSFLTVKDGEAMRLETQGLTEQVYLIDPTVEPGLIAKYKNAPGNPFTVLSDKYELAVSNELGMEQTKEFREWLLRSSRLNFASQPILVHNGMLTAEWWFLVERNITDLLSVVKSNYSKKAKPPPETLTWSLRALEVPCQDGVTRPLYRLAVPTPELLQKCPHLDFVDLPNPELENWKFLSKFGVITTCNTVARLRELQALGKLPPETIDKDSIKEIYRALNLNLSTEDYNIR